MAAQKQNQKNRNRPNRPGQKLNRPISQMLVQVSGSPMVTILGCSLKDVPTDKPRSLEDLLRNGWRVTNMQGNLLLLAKRRTVGKGKGQGGAKAAT